jgi:hypothetical protein
VVAGVNFKDSEGTDPVVACELKFTFDAGTNDLSALTIELASVDPTTFDTARVSGASCTATECTADIPGNGYYYLREGEASAADPPNNTNTTDPSDSDDDNGYLMAPLLIILILMGGLM